MRERALHEGGCQRPALAIDVEAGIGSVAEEAGDGYVRGANLPEKEPRSRKLVLEIVERRRNILILRLADPLLVRRLTPHQRFDDSLVEQSPDEEVTEARIGIFLQPARMGAVFWVSREQSMPRISLVEVGADHR